MGQRWTKIRIARAIMAKTPGLYNVNIISFIISNPSNMNVPDLKSPPPKKSKGWIIVKVGMHPV